VSSSATDTAITAAVIDPTLLVLLPIIGVVATIFGGLIGAWIQGRREHKKWIREKRYDAFLKALKIIRNLQHDAEKLKLLRKADEEPAALRARLHAARIESDAALGDLTGPLEILGPPPVNDALSAYIAVALADDEKARDAAHDAYVAATRRALSIKD
jgi:hypothetical protein